MLGRNAMAVKRKAYQISSDPSVSRIRACVRARIRLPCSRSEQLRVLLADYSTSEAIPIRGRRTKVGTRIINAILLVGPSSPRQRT